MFGKMVYLQIYEMYSYRLSRRLQKHDTLSLISAHLKSFSACRMFQGICVNELHYSSGMMAQLGKQKCKVWQFTQMCFVSVYKQHLWDSMRNKKLWWGLESVFDIVHPNYVPRGVSLVPCGRNQVNFPEWGFDLCQCCTKSQNFEKRWGMSRQHCCISKCCIWHLLKSFSLEMKGLMCNVTLRDKGAISVKVNKGKESKCFEVFPYLC